MSTLVKQSKPQQIPNSGSQRFTELSLTVTLLFFLEQIPYSRAMRKKEKYLSFTPTPTPLPETIRQNSFYQQSKVWYCLKRGTWTEVKLNKAKKGRTIGTPQRSTIIFSPVKNGIARWVDRNQKIMVNPFEIFVTHMGSTIPDVFGNTLLWMTHYPTFGSPLKSARVIMEHLRFGWMKVPRGKGQKWQFLWFGGFGPLWTCRNWLFSLCINDSRFMSSNEKRNQCLIGRITHTKLIHLYFNFVFKTNCDREQHSKIS